MFADKDNNSLGNTSLFEKRIVIAHRNGSLILNLSLIHI